MKLMDILQSVLEKIQPAHVGHRLVVVHIKFVFNTAVDHFWL